MMQLFMHTNSIQIQPKTNFEDIFRGRLRSELTECHHYAAQCVSAYGRVNHTGSTLGAEIRAGFFSGKARTGLAFDVVT